jgi:sulfur-oxidizing protein SoxZ
VGFDTLQGVPCPEPVEGSARTGSFKFIDAGSINTGPIRTQWVRTNFRVDAMGRTQSRDIVRQVEARLNGALVFAVDVHPAIAANPFLSFHPRVNGGGELQVNWRGDYGFVHSESALIAVT